MSKCRCHRGRSVESGCRVDRYVSSGEIVKIRAIMTYKRYQANSSPSESLYERNKAGSNDAEFRVLTMSIWDIKEVKLAGGRFVYLTIPLHSL
jgi:hypothetical protein